MKSGLDYFSLDVAIDTKFELIEAEFGLNGFGVIVKLLGLIYGGEGYYTEWTSEVALLFSRKIGLGVNAVSEIVSAAVRRNIFDKEIFEKYHILTSSGIQKRYFEAIKRRKEIEVESDYLLIEVSQILKDVNIIEKNAYKSSKNVSISKQSKVKQSKVEKSNISDAFSRFWQVYPVKYNLEKAREEFEKLNPDETLLCAMLTAIENQKQTVRWQKDDGQFIPYPDKWIKNRRWTDDVAAAVNDSIDFYSVPVFKKED